MKLALLLVVASACASSPARGPGTLRFANAEPVTRVADDTPIPRPEAREQGLVAYYLGEDFLQPTLRALTVGEARSAANVNSLGEVPDSSWFTNRKPTPEQIRTGPGKGGPAREGAWKVVGVKVGGAAIGILIVDAHGDRYILKFDEDGHAETETAADVIVQRLAWAMGYNVPDNDVVTFTREQLELDASAVIRDRTGGKRPMKTSDLAHYLDMVEHTGDEYRALASRFVDGTPIGGIEPQGTRSDDPNDRVPHERRRELRGQGVLWAWVNHPDLKTQNSLAVYTKDKHVRWYALDFGESLGVGARTTGVTRLGHRPALAPREVGLSLVTFGAYVYPWERKRDYPDYKGLGFFDAESFEPGRWVANHSWRPIEVADRFDELWAVERLLKLTPAHVAAAVAAGRYSDKRTTDYVTRTLLARKDKLVRYVLDRVAPLVELTARSSAVCFTDLAVRHGIADATTTRYRATTYDYDGALLGVAPDVGAATTGASCLGALRVGHEHDAYTIVRIDTWRGKRALPVMYVHVARGPAGMRVVGLDRR